MSYNPYMFCATECARERDRTVTANYFANSNNPMTLYIYILYNLSVTYGDTMI